MKTFALAFLLVFAGCATASKDPNPPMRAGGPDWEKIDQSVQRIKEREQNKARLVETARTREEGFRPMSDADYAAALETARAEIKKANPKIADADLEKEATLRADTARRQYEQAFTRSASSTYEWKKP